MNWKPPQTVTINPPQLPAWFNGKTIAAIFVGLVILAGAFTSVYTVPVDSQAVVLRFGEYIKTEPRGLRYKLPFGIDRHIIVPTERQLNMVFGGAAGDPDFARRAPTRNEQEKERSMITGDRNAVAVEWVVQWRVNEPMDFLFRVRDPEGTLRAAAESVMRQVIGDRSVDEVLTVGRQDVAREVSEGLSEISRRYELGIEINQVQLQDVTPPVPVQPSFNEVNQAQQERERLINEARGEFNRIVPRARGEADRNIAEAEGRATRRVNEAEGDATRFRAVFDEYVKAPEVTRQRLYLETMSEVLPTFRRRVIMDEGAAGVLPLLQLDSSN